MPRRGTSEITPAATRFTKPIPGYIRPLALDARQLMAGHPLVVTMATSQDKNEVIRAIRKALELFWPIVEAFPEIVQGTASVYHKALRPLSSRERKDVRELIGNQLSDVDGDEKLHKQYWQLAAKQTGAILNPVFSNRNIYVDFILRQLRSETPSTRLAALAGIEINAYAWSATVMKSRTFKQVLGPEGCKWWEAHMSSDHLMLLCRMMSAVEVLSETSMRLAVLDQTQNFMRALNLNN